MSKKNEFEDLAGKVILKGIMQSNLDMILNLKVKLKLESIVATNVKSITEAQNN